MSGPMANPHHSPFQAEEALIRKYAKRGDGIVGIAIVASPRIHLVFEVQVGCGAIHVIGG